MKITNHRPFMQFSVLMELYEKWLTSICPYMKNVRVSVSINQAFCINTEPPFPPFKLLFKSYAGFDGFFVAKKSFSYNTKNRN